ncbi:hypothetical protein [Pseudomonas sp. MWU16-30317]|uniref:hypothetical protein n=1 Tax=Pseudomonas sp. MWU16-30317 TaxID=2878095 RepID=UPI001CFB82A7|nr:hypothetical protein [Pseudomonas sp. MWU16-30317]
MNTRLHPLYRCAVAMLGATALVGSLAVHADDQVPLGITVVRGDSYGASANEAGNYEHEPTNANDQLEDVSALCGKKTGDTAASLVGTDKSCTWGHYMTTLSTTVINLKGHIARTPLPKNPNHCSIRGLTVKQIKGVWSQ